MNTLIHRLFPLGIRLQLMLWYTAVFAALLLFVGAVFYQYLEHTLEASLDTTLHIRAQQIAGVRLAVRDDTGPASPPDPVNKSCVQAWCASQQR